MLQLCSMIPVKNFSDDAVVRVMLLENFGDDAVMQHDVLKKFW